MFDRQYPMRRLDGRQELPGRPIRLGDVGRRRAVRSNATPFVKLLQDEVPMAPLGDFLQACKRLFGPPEAGRLWEALIKGLGRVLGLGDAPQVAPAPDDAAEDGPQTFHRSGCSVFIPMGAIFLLLHPGMAVASSAAVCLL